MVLVSLLKSFCRNLFARRKVDQDLDDELKSYIELATERKRQEGLTEAEARRAVLIELEGTEQLKERIWSQRSSYRFEVFLQDVRFAFRSLRKAPVFALTILAVLALGIGSTTLMFAIINSVLLQGSRYPNADRIVTLWNRIPEEPRVSFSPREFAAWSKKTQLFESFAFVTGTGFTLSGRGDPEMITGRMVTPSLFKVLGVGPFLGRAFSEQDSGQHLVVVSYPFWREKFGSRPESVGETVLLNGDLYTVIGVMPESFRFEAPDAKLFVPAALDSPVFADHPDAHFLRVFGRLKAGVSRQQLDAEVGLLGPQVADSNDHTPRRYFALSLMELTTGELRKPLGVLLSAVVFLLLVACANVANLVLARTNARHAEIVLRAALGATRPRLVGQLFIESSLLAVAGGVLGVGLASWALAFLTASLGQNVPEIIGAHVGTPAVFAAFGASVLSALLFGLGPAWSAGKISSDADLKNFSRSTRRTLRTHQVLVFGEVALAAALLVGCILMIRSFSALIHVSPGFQTKNIVTAEVFLPKDRYPNGSALFAFYRRALGSVQTAAGVERTGMVTHLPFGGNSFGNTFEVEGYASPGGEEHSAQIRPVSPGYFETLGIPLRAGRSFTDSDDDKSRVAIVNLALVRRFWPNESPIGRRIRYYQDWLTIVGVCGDIKHARLDAESDMEIYVPYLQLVPEVAQFVGRDLNFVMQSSQPAVAADAARDAIRALDPQTVVKINTMAALIHESTAQPRFRTWLVAIFSGSAVVLACLGIYGVIAYLVTQRYKEIGIRMALGATRTNIVRLFLRRTASLSVAAIGAGLIAAAGLSRFMASMLFGIGPHDPLTFIGVPACLLAVALLAAYLPARRASRVDPVTSLRYE